MIFLCCNGSPCPSASAQSAIPASKSTIPGSSGYWKSCCMAAIPSAVGPPNTSMKPSSTTFQLSAKSYGLNRLRYDLCKLKGHGLLERDGRHYAYPTHCKGYPGRPPVPLFPQTPVRAARQQSLSPLGPIQPTVRTPNSRPRITRLTKLSKISLPCLPLPDITFGNVEVFLFTILDLKNLNLSFPSRVSRYRH